MLDPGEKEFIREKAYLPEHLVDYVQAVSGAEAHLIQGHLCYFRENHLIFIGHPLVPAGSTAAAYQKAKKHFQPATTAVQGADLKALGLEPEDIERDEYYVLELPFQPPSPKTANMVRRAQREALTSRGVFGEEHRELIDGFTGKRIPGEAQARIFRRIGGYLAASPSALILEARKDGVLKAFNVLDTGSRDTAFWMFSFRDLEAPLPGVSDLLFKEMAETARAKGKKTLNLGLGINPGIRRFKGKWGGYPALTHESALVGGKKPGFTDILRLLRP